MKSHRNSITDDVMTSGKADHATTKEHRKSKCIRKAMQLHCKQSMQLHNYSKNRIENQSRSSSRIEKIDTGDSLKVRSIINRSFKLSET